MCGAFLIVGDAQSRVDDHLMGKQHMGYAKIKSTVEELKVIGLCVTVHLNITRCSYIDSLQEKILVHNKVNDLQ